MSTLPGPFLIETASEDKHEYHNGEMFAMSGASRRPVIIDDNLTSMFISHQVSIRAPI